MRIVEITDTISGELPILGLPVTLIRLGDCNLNCAWCDTEWSKWTEMSVIDVFEKVHHRNVLITGGEPLYRPDDELVELRELMSLIKKEGRSVYIETNGTLFDQAFWDCVVIADLKSPSSGEVSDYVGMRTVSNAIDYFKVVIKTPDDWMFFLDVLNDFGGKPPVIIASMDPYDHNFVELFKQEAAKRTDVKMLLSLQAHKLWDVK